MVLRPPACAGPGRVHVACNQASSPGTCGQRSVISTWLRLYCLPVVSYAPKRIFIAVRMRLGCAGAGRRLKCLRT
eukprot:1291731-Rhodomonas_salina.1